MHEYMVYWSSKKLKIYGTLMYLVGIVGYLIIGRLWLGYMSYFDFKKSTMAMYMLVPMVVYNLLAQSTVQTTTVKILTMPAMLIGYVSSFLPIPHHTNLATEYNYFIVSWVVIVVIHFVIQWSFDGVDTAWMLHIRRNESRRKRL